MTYAFTPALALTLLLACTVRQPGDSDSADATGTATTTTDGTTSDTTGDTPTGSGSADSGVTTTTPGETGVVTLADTGDATTDDPPEFCPPADPAFFHFELDPAPDDFADIILEWDCQVLEAQTTIDGAALAFDCTADGTPVDPPPRLLVTANPPPPTLAITPGQPVHIRYEQEVPWWTERALRITADETILLASDRGSGLVDAFTDVLLKPLEPACPPAEDDDFCGPVQHEALSVTVDGASGDVQSRNFTAFGAYGVWASELTHYVEGPNCTDTPDRWRNLGLLRLTP